MSRTEDAANPAFLSLRLFGPLTVILNGQPLPRLHSRRGSLLLALLALRGTAPVERSWLAGALWHDSPEAAALASLRNTISDLRRALGPEAARLSTPSRSTVCLNLTGADVDVLAFDQAMARGDLLSLEQAIALYRGPLLEGWTEEWLFQERQIREQAYLGALERVAERAREKRDVTVAESYLRRAIGVDPLRESAHRALMEGLATAGNYAAATEVYRTLRSLLHRELNAEPAPETTALYQQIRAQAQAKAGKVTKVAGQPIDLEADRQPPAVTLSRSEATLPEGTVTFLLTDIEGSTRLLEQHPERMRQALARHHVLVTEALLAHDGAIITSQGEGDSFFAVFSCATDAVDAALALQRALHAEAWSIESGLRVRVALHTGEAELRGGDYFGVAVNRCARVRSVAHGGQLLLTAATQGLVRDALPEGASLRDLGEHRLKDLIRPERLYQLLHPALSEAFPPLRSLESRRQNLPVQATPLLGREQEVAAACELLYRDDVRLLTLTGPGGIGKTRLGLQVAAELMDQFRDGVFFVDLAPLMDATLVASTIAHALAIRESPGQPLVTTLKEELREKQLLLLLDNFEHVLAAAPLVAELLAAAPGLKALVTSRAVLRLRGEQEFAVPPLAVPDLRRLPPVERLSQYAAVELFIQRARAVKPEFSVSNETAPAVAEICHRLDGLPLAIELAAARVRLFSPEALLTRLRKRLQVLTGGARDLPARQQTLRDAIAWSYDLLHANEQKLFRRLSVFVGGCTLESVEAVCTMGGELGFHVLESLTSLVEQSLLRVQEAGGEPRFVMLETIHDFALERLIEVGEAEALRRQHAGFFLNLAEQAEPELVGAVQGKWLDLLEMEHANLLATLEWAKESSDAEAGLRLVVALGRYWEVRGHWTGVRDRLTEFLELVNPCSRTTGRANALNFAGRLARLQGDYDTSRILHEEVLAIRRGLGDRAGIASSLNNLGHLATVRGDYEAARAFQEEGLAIWRELGDRRGIANSLTQLGWTCHIEGDYGMAGAFYEESLSTWRAIDDMRGIGSSLSNLGALAKDQGDDKAAQALFEESLTVARAIGDRLGVGSLLGDLGSLSLSHGDAGAAQALYRESLGIMQALGEKLNLIASLEGLAGTAEIQRQFEQAARLFAAAQGLRDTIAALRPTSERAEHERRVATVRSTLGEEAFAAAWAAGRAMAIEEAIAFALEGIDAASGAAE